MSRRPRLPSLPVAQALSMPLRDALRGLAGVADLTEELLEPLRRAVPAPVLDALRALEGRGARLLEAGISEADIGAAAAFLAGPSARRSDAFACARVLAFAWDHLRRREEPSLLLSEVLTAARLGTIADRTAGPPMRAAQLVLALRDAHVAGRIPGLPVTLDEGEKAAIELRLCGLAVWLLAERGTSLAEEVRLLDLADALVAAESARLRAAMGDPAALAQALHEISDHL
ncbi:MAG: hypothetical protein KatS3mg118_1415 [Paracoccaceae bacterium]|nr:MAG: hypothetical protein KatS3mg118_1415 [Paracoccaceae bacterium]